MATPTDPFAAPAPVASAFASADSFRGRLVLIKPTKLEYDIPKSAANPTGPCGNRITANVTVVDGSGPVQVFSNRVPTGVMLDGPEHIGVWFNQDRLATSGGLIDPSQPNLATGRPGQLLPLVLGRLETYKPGQPAGQGNPWGLLPPSEEDKQTARNFLAGQTMAKVAGPAGPAATGNPFA